MKPPPGAWLILLVIVLALSVASAVLGMLFG